MTDPTAALAAGLRDRYVLERPLGRGGMATVYLARDLKHDRPVALKVLLPELAASLGPDRFQREIRLAARLQWRASSTGSQTYNLRGDAPETRVYADSARLAFEERLRATPDDDQGHAFRGLALAYLGRKTEAIAEGERAVALVPISRDAYGGAYDQHQLVRMYLLVGEPEKALDQLEPLLKIPFYLSPGWLRIDPTFAPLKGNPRFERLVAGK